MIMRGGQGGSNPSVVLMRFHEQKNYGFIKKLKNKEMTTRLSALSPEIFTRAEPFLEMVKPVPVPHHYFSIINLRDEFSSRVAIITNS